MYVTWGCVRLVRVGVNEDLCSPLVYVCDGGMCGVGWGGGGE